MDAPATQGVAFARALAAKDFSRLLELLHPGIDFHGLTPGSAGCGCCARGSGRYSAAHMSIPPLTAHTCPVM